MSKDKVKPIHEIRLGRIKAAIWQNEAQNIKYYSVTIVRLYKDGSQWKDTTSFRRDDLPLLAKIADRAHSWIFDQSQEHSGSRENQSSDFSPDEF